MWGVQKSVQGRRVAIPQRGCAATSTIVGSRRIEVGKLRTERQANSSALIRCPVPTPTLRSGRSSNACPIRTWTVILLAFRHGLRAAELCATCAGTKYTFNAAGAARAGQEREPAARIPLLGNSYRRCDACSGRACRPPFVFVSERGTPFTTAGFARMIERAPSGGGLELKAHPHMLRLACGYALANKDHDTRWLGHRSITGTAIYTALAVETGSRIFWRD